MSTDLGKELRIIHACELGAVGVYRGHKCVARYLFRSSLPELDNMRFHEKSHAAIFAALLTERGMRLCIAHQLFFWGGLFYGVSVGLLGLKAIGTSTYTIEMIVDHEFDEVIEKLDDNHHLREVIKGIQLEEQEHRDTGAELAGGRSIISKAVSKIARWGAYTAKYAAANL